MAASAAMGMAAGTGAAARAARTTALLLILDDAAHGQHDRDDEHQNDENGW